MYSHREPAAKWSRFVCLSEKFLYWEITELPALTAVVNLVGMPDESEILGKVIYTW